MRFLADESCDFIDVVAIGELARRLEDEAVLDLAVRERRILLTEDKDLGKAGPCQDCGAARETAWRQACRSVHRRATRSNSNPRDSERLKVV
ncbi:MAG: DUF5615 family PIN-like protein [Candidatus Methylomirabilales bacterium]